MSVAVEQVLEKYHDYIMSISGASYTGIGWKNGAKCIVVYIVKKKPLGQLPFAKRIPADFDGILTDVIESGRVRPSPF